MKDIYMLISVGIIATCVGCHQSNPFEEMEKHSEEFRSVTHDHDEEGYKLTDVAGKATLPPAEKSVQKKLQLSAQAEALVGRYRVLVDCGDPFVHCENGTAEFILNLLPDGTAHRIFIHMGKVTFASSHEYRQDTWFYDHALHQVILIRGSGVQFYYDIDQAGNLIMDLEKIAHFTPENREYFANGHPFPQQAYVLTRMS